LRDGNKDTGVGSGADDVEEGVDTGRGTGGEVDLGGVGGEAISLCETLLDNCNCCKTLRI
jgi:hypothetical protein